MSSSSTEEGETLHHTSLSWLGDMEVGTGPGTKETIVQKFARLRFGILLRSWTS